MNSRQVKRVSTLYLVSHQQERGKSLNGRDAIRELQINRKQFLAYLEGRLISEIPDQPERGTNQVLSSYRSHSNKEWTLQMRGSHRRVTVLEWCISSMMLLGNEADDWLREVALILPRSTLEYDVLKRVETQFCNLTPEEIREYSETNPRYSAIYHMTKKVNHGYTPRISFLKLWDPIRVKPKAYIGVGYSDKGHLGDSPSWQSQMISAEDGTLPDSKSFLGMILESL